MLNQIAPTPAPTITVTETLTVTPPPPVVNVQVPPDSWDWWRDVVLGDFGGAAFGVVGALAAAVIGAVLVNRAAQRVREEDSRQLLAQEYADTARQLAKDLGPDALLDNHWVATLSRFDTLTGRIVRQYLQDPLHKNFATWISLHAQPIGIKLEPVRWAYRDKEVITSDMDRLTALLQELSTDVTVIEHTTLEWMMRKPADWSPDTSARAAHERVKKLLNEWKRHPTSTD